MKIKKGFTFVELLLTVCLIFILISVSIPYWNRFLEINKFNNDIMKVEYAINRAKILAMEKLVNIGVCIKESSKKIDLYNIGFQRSNNPCIGTLIFEISIKSPFSDLKSNGTIIFDPRGLNIMREGEVCIQNSKLNRYYKIIVGTGYQKIEKGEGLCP